jgi:periplasmic protein TonB
LAALRIRVVRRGGVASPARRFIVGSLVAHFVLAAALILIPSLRRGPRIPADATVVELVGALPGPRTVAPPGPPAPAPEPEPPPPAPVATPTPAPKPATKQKAPKEPKKPTAPAATPAPAAATPAPEAATTPPGTGGGAASDAGSAAAGASVSAGGFEDASLAWYRSALANALYGAWKRPIVSGLTQAVEVRVSFEIMRDGNVRGLRIDESSGVPMLDRSALRAVSDASPLPALPATMGAPYVPASIVFRLYPEGAQG